MLTAVDQALLTRTLEVAAAASAAGEQPYAAVLTDAGGTELVAEHNRTAAGDPLAHAELAVARWAVANLPPERRATTVLYCSGEPCPMCAGAHGWAGLGRIVYAVAATRIVEWRTPLGVPPPPVATLPVRELLPGAAVDGPLPSADTRVQALSDLFRRS